MLEISPSDCGAAFAVRVAPRASADAVAGVENSALKVRLTAPPVEGAANKALIKLLAKALGVSKGSVRLIAGQKSKNKRLLVEGLTPEQVRERLGL